jgi:glucosamine 6-phosphate synthetase-like amidotransferase/phosphosugar isomerase protein
LCGIIGFAGQVPEGMWGQTFDLLKGLYRSSMSRGIDATGFVARTSPLDGSNGKIVLSKMPVPADQFIKANHAFRRLGHRRCTMFIGHVRAATHGSPDKPGNNHPFVSENQNLYLVHNGIISNHTELADYYSLRLTSDCDSEVLLRLIEFFPEPSAGIMECLRKVKGSMAIALLDRKSDWVWLARNSARPLWLARVRNDRRWFFASTDSILTKTFKSVLGSSALHGMEYLAPVPADTALILTPNGNIIASQTI